MEQGQINATLGVERKRQTDVGAFGVDAGGEGVVEEEFNELDALGLDAAAWEAFLQHIWDTPGRPFCWGSPELRAFREAGRPDGRDACPLLKKAFETPIGSIFFPRGQCS